MTDRKLRVLGLFSGIGGFELGLQRAGLEIAAMCEIDPFCRRVLAKHWPEVPVYEDVRELTGDRLAADGIGVDVICGGFPCQDISGAGRKAGIGGSRSGLWADYLRVVREIRPSFVVVENVADLLVRGIDLVLGNLAQIGLDAEWHAIPACALGAPHERDRVWIIAHPEGQPGRRGMGQGVWSQPQGRQSQDGFGESAFAYSPPMLRRSFIREQQDRALRSHWWRHWRDYAASLRGMDDGVRGRVDGLSALGNAVIPQIPEMIGRAILEAVECQSA